jgi:Fe-S-cluster-containing dehydrogenase component/formate-dependent nitrite reductase membrane component NrfD
MRELPVYPAEQQRPQWGKVIDHTRCIGCHACTTACKSENLVPLSVTRTYVKHVDVGEFPLVRRAHQVTRCNQCAHAPCVAACPTAAMFKRGDGIVDFDKSICIGCKACMAACPYDAIFINPEDHSAEKCNFCAHRIDMGLEPACVVVCPVEAILVGDMNDADSKVAQIVNREAVNVRRPEKETLPKLFYKGAHQSTLDPLAASRPGGGLFMWSEQREGTQWVVSGNPQYRNTSAAALLSYDVPHTIPWDWRVSLYTWTKGISAGTYLVSVMLAFLAEFYSSMGAGDSLRNSLTIGWALASLIMSGTFLAITGGLLIWDLEHPARFFLIFTRPQWHSWLVKGAFIIAGYSLILALHFAAAVLEIGWMHYILIFPGVPLAVLTAVYTAYLFAQAKARDLWQNPLLPPHMLVQSVLAGSAALGLPAYWMEPRLVAPLLWIAGGASLLHLLMIAGEVTMTHPTTHARLAVWEMTSNRYRAFFWSGIGLALAGVIAPLLGIVAVPFALAGLLFYEHAYVQAGQCVPLA